MDRSDGAGRAGPYRDAAPGFGNETGDPYDTFLPPALRIDDNTPEDALRAVVFIDSTTNKGTSRAGQEYASPLLMLIGPEYTAMPFQALHDRLCDALRGDRPRLVMEVFGGEGRETLVFEDGSTTPGPPLPMKDGSGDSD